MADRRSFLAALLAAPVAASKVGTASGAELECLGPDRQYFLEWVSKTVMRASDYEREEYFNKPWIKEYTKNQGLSKPDPLRRLCITTGDENWKYTYSVDRRS